MNTCFSKRALSRIVSCAKAEPPPVGPPPHGLHSCACPVGFVHCIPVQGGIGTMDARAPRCAPMHHKQRQQRESNAQLAVDAGPEGARAMIVDPNKIITGAETGQSRAIEEHQVSEVA